MGKYRESTLNVGASFMRCVFQFFSRYGEQKSRLIGYIFYVGRGTGYQGGRLYKSQLFGGERAQRRRDS